MEFPNTTSEEDKISYQEGFRIFGELRKKYSNQNIRDLDIVLNSLCFAIVRLGKLNTIKGDEEAFSDLVKQIILKNMKD